MRAAHLLVLALAAACSGSGAAPEPEAPRAPAPPPTVTPAPLQPPSTPVTSAPRAPSPAPSSPNAPDASDPIDPLDAFPHGAPTLVWGKPLPPPPTAYEPEAEARAAPHQACTRDRDCTVAIEGCCDENGYARGIGVARKQLEAYRREFRCRWAKCATRAGDMLCGEPPTPSCETVPVPKARCVEGRCTFHGHY